MELVAVVVLVSVVLAAVVRAWRAVHTRRRLATMTPEQRAAVLATALRRARSKAGRGG